MQVLEKTVIDRSSAGDGSQLDTRFVCKLCHYDMTWPRVRVQQMRRLVPTETVVEVDHQEQQLHLESADAEDFEHYDATTYNDADYDHHSHNQHQHQPAVTPIYDQDFSNGYESILPCVECRAIDSLPAVSVACIAGHPQCLQAILDYAVAQYRQQLQQCNGVDEYDVVIEEGVSLTTSLVQNTNWNDALGRSPLHFAASGDAGMACLEVLINFGFDALYVVLLLEED